MAQRHEIEAWVNPSAWDDQDGARRIVEAIMESGSDDEADWVRIAAEVFEQGGRLPVEVLAAASRDYDRAADQMDLARDRLYAVIREARTDGASAADIAAAVGMSRQMVSRIIRG